jgi:hypothetical protein
MNTRPIKAIILLALAGLFLGMSACATSSDVRNIVDEANQASIAASLDAAAASLAPFPSTTVGGEGSTAATDATDTTDAAERISSWIAQHQDQPRIVDPLRLRLAYLLLQQGKPNSGQVVYEDITDAANLPSELQQVLYTNWQAYKWWWRAKGQESFSEADYDQATAFHAQLVAQADQADRTPYIRSMLHQLAINIRFKHAVRSTRKETVKSLSEEGLQRYATQFSADERNAIKMVNSEQGIADIDGTMLRWYLRVPLTYACFGKLWQILDIDGAGDLTPEWARTDPPTQCPLNLQ